MSKVDEDGDFTAWRDVKAAVSDSKAEDDRAITVVCVCQSHNPASMHQLGLLKELEADNLIPYCRVFYVNADLDEHVCKEADLSATPAVLIYWRSEAVSIERQSTSASNALVGSVRKEALATLLRDVRRACQEGLRCVKLDDEAHE